mmetsp:Transcript_20020/g.35729  ORF Transcript_20020/g.35729 Transcript_20020/m.35729 type:complete len:117 (+) Transcript_20020:2355-2705(+)
MIRHQKWNQDTPRLQATGGLSRCAYTAGANPLPMPSTTNTPCNVQLLQSLAPHAICNLRCWDILGDPFWAVAPLRCGAATGVSFCRRVAGPSPRADPTPSPASTRNRLDKLHSNWV